MAAQFHPDDDTPRDQHQGAAGRGSAVNAAPTASALLRPRPMEVAVQEHVAELPSRVVPTRERPEIR